MRSLIFTFWLTLVVLICYGQKVVDHDFKYNIDEIFVDTIGGGDNAFLIKSGYTSTQYDILIHDTLSTFTEDRHHFKIEVLGSQNRDSAIYYYFVEKVNNNLVLSAIAFYKFKKGGYKASEIYVFGEKLLTYYFDDNFYLFFYDDKVNLLDIVGINGKKIMFEKSFVNKMPFFANHIDRANPIIPINNGLPVSTFESSFNNKLYKENKKFIFTFDMYVERFNEPYKYGNSTEILEVDLSADVTNYTIVRAEEVEEILLYNSFYLDNKLYRISVSYNYLNIAAYDIASKTLINQHSIYQNDSVGKLTSSPYYERVGSKRSLSLLEFKKSKKLIKTHYVGAPSISAYTIDDKSVQLTIGNYSSDNGFFISIGSASLIHNIVVSALATAIMNINTGISTYFYSHFSKDKFMLLAENKNTLARTVDDKEVDMVNNKNKMRKRKYFLSSGKLNFIYQDANSKQLNIID